MRGTILWVLASKNIFQKCTKHLKMKGNNFFSPDECFSLKMFSLGKNFYTETNGPLGLVVFHVLFEFCFIAMLKPKVTTVKIEYSLPPYFCQVAIIFANKTNMVFICFIFGQGAEMVAEGYM